MTKPVNRPYIIIPPGILGYRGVRIRRDGRRSKPFYARIRINNEEIYTANFSRPHEAALAYDELALKLHGEKAVLNFPAGGYALPSPHQGPS